MVDLSYFCDEIDKLIQDLGGYWPKEWLIQPVIEELGEFAKELQIEAGLHPNKSTTKEKLSVEFGDLLFTVLALGRGLGIDIEQSLTKTLAKYRNRDVKST
jgi:NTP pyrophosphatase (non-canonical NTP hydrolase)